MKKHELPTIAEFDLDIDLGELRRQTNALADKYVDVMSANPALCMNHKDLVKQVYDNFNQINLTTPSELLPHTASIKERLRRKEEHLYNVPTPEYAGSVFESIVTQLESPASRIRLTKLEAGKEIPFHVDYDVSYAVRCIVPIYTNEGVINLFKRDNEIEEYHLEAGKAYFLNIGYPHSVVNSSDESRIALMFSLEGTNDISRFRL